MTNIVCIMSVTPRSPKCLLVFVLLAAGLCLMSGAAAAGVRRGEDKSSSAIISDFHAAGSNTFSGIRQLLQRGKEDWRRVWENTEDDVGRSETTSPVDIDALREDLIRQLCEESGANLPEYDCGGRKRRYW